MIQKAIVNSIGEKITVIPLKKDECVSCPAACGKNSTPLEVSNPLNLDLKKGSVVLITASKKVQTIQGFFSLFIPIFCAILGYFLANPILSIFNKTAKDGTKALFVLIFLLFSASVVYFISRKSKFLGKAQIVEIL